MACWYSAKLNAKLILGTVDIINNTTRVKLTATKNGSLTTPVERGLDITFHVQVDKDEQVYVATNFSYSYIAS